VKSVIQISSSEDQENPASRVKEYAKRGRYLYGAIVRSGKRRETESGAICQDSSEGEKDGVPLKESVRGGKRRDNVETSLEQQEKSRN